MLTYKTKLLFSNQEIEDSGEFYACFSFLNPIPRCWERVFLVQTSASSVSQQYLMVLRTPIKQILTYKAQALGKRVETVPPEYTSQEDCRTSERSGVRRGCRYICNDGIVFDADWNASVNIAKRYLKCKHSDSFALPFDGILNLTDRVLQLLSDLQSLRS